MTQPTREIKARYLRPGMTVLIGDAPFTVSVVHRYAEDTVLAYFDGVPSATSYGVEEGVTVVDAQPAPTAIAWPAVADPAVATSPTWYRRTDPLPVRQDPAIEARDTEIVGRLTFLLREIAYQAAEYDVPADLQRLIDTASRIAQGDLPEWQQQPADLRRAA